MRKDSGSFPVHKAARLALTGFLFAACVALLWNYSDLDLWIKAFHIMAVIAWMAGLFYLPRLFVYHAQTDIGSETAENFKVMEQRLLNIIMKPAMMMTWGFGLYLAWSLYGFQGGWLHAKIALVIVMTGLHVYFGYYVKIFARNENRKSARFWRIMNEAPTLLMIAIVILVVVKPF